MLIPTLFLSLPLTVELSNIAENSPSATGAPVTPDKSWPPPGPTTCKGKSGSATFTPIPLFLTENLETASPVVSESKAGSMKYVLVDRPAPVAPGVSVRTSSVLLLICLTVRISVPSASFVNLIASPAWRTVVNDVPEPVTVAVEILSRVPAP